MRDEKGGSLQAPNFKDVTEVQTPDDQTVVVVTKQPLAIFLDRLENRFVLSKVAGDKFGDKLYENPIGTGPYKFVSYQRGGNMVFTRNDDYWGGKAAIKEVIFRKVTEDAAGSTVWNRDKPISSKCAGHEVAAAKTFRAVSSTRSRSGHGFHRLQHGTNPWDNKLVSQAAQLAAMLRPS